MANPDIYVPWDGWRVKGSLGRGSFGTVYEIEKSEAGSTERKAMKVISISTDMIDDIYGSKYSVDTARKIAEESLASIRREYDIMYELRGNPNIVRCDDMKVVGHRDGIGCDVYIMMELLTPLQKSWRQDDISEEDVLALGKDICRALEACERHHLIHRDIKPQNILVTDNGTYKLGDFGTARTFENTTSATMAGTETYMAPEVLFRRKYGRDVDTYSLGLVMYRMLNRGQLPFIDPDKIPTPDERARSLQKRLNGEALPAPATGSRPLKAVVLKACSYDRRDRYASATDMLDDLFLAEDGTMPMFPETTEDRKTVVENTSTYAGEKTQKMPDDLRPGGRKGGGKGTGKSSGKGSGGKNVKGTPGLSKKWIAAIAAGVLAIVIILMNMGGQPDDPVSDTDTDTGTATEETAEDTSGDTGEAVSTEGVNTENFLTAFRNGNYDEAASWGSKNPEYVNEGVVLNMPSDISAAYESKAQEFANDPDGFYGYYGYTDIDNDGTPEMVLFTPGGEADKRLRIYTYDSGNVSLIAELSGGHTVVYAYPGHNGLVVEWAHMGEQAYSVISIEDGELRQEDFGSMQLAEGETAEDYLDPGNMVFMNTIE